jgi:alkanesulfonate monooxygenase SsuD/methylene tetrahydromethanopterin reductase-like flavin-dependent oxidoreductase (luciferase family)
VRVKAGIVINAGDPLTQVDLAVRAEQAGWDGVFTWDAIDIAGTEIHDPWALLAAWAPPTSSVTLGAIVFAPARRRPWKLAREAVTVDHLSRGRLVLPVGLGTLDDRGFGAVGETTDTRERAAILDETLAILDGLWSGGPFEHRGAHYVIDRLTLLPRPVQRPRIPIWVVVRWPSERSVARAVRWDGAILQTTDVDEVRAAVMRMRTMRAESHRPDAFEIAVQGSSPPDASASGAVAQPYADAGATWWIEADWEHAEMPRLLARIAAGPPRVS